MREINVQADRSLIEGDPAALVTLATLAAGAEPIRILDAQQHDVTLRYLVEAVVKGELRPGLELLRRHLAGRIAPADVEATVRRVILAGLGAASLVGERSKSAFDELVRRGETSPAAYAVAVRETLAQAETLPVKLQTRLSELRPPADPLANLMAKVDALAARVGDLQAARKSEDGPMKKSASAA